MSTGSLFRQEVLENRKHRHFGTVSLYTPKRYVFGIVGFSLLIFMGLTGVLMGHFSEKFIVRGLLESTQPESRVYPHRQGVIGRAFVKQGDLVKKGDPLFLIDTSSLGWKASSQQEALSRKELKSLDQAIAARKDHLQALQPLLEKKYIARAIIQEEQAVLMALEHQKNTMAVSLLDHQQEASTVIQAPMKGMISSVMVQEGQTAHLEKPLLSIIPNPAIFLAKLYVPARQAGLINKQVPIVIRYDAYPYTRFGAVEATIEGMSRSVLTDEDEEKPIRVGEPYYTLTAKLDKQFVIIYGKKTKLQHGMSMTAVIRGSKRRVWQWIFDPVYSLYGGLFS